MEFSRDEVDIAQPCPCYGQPANCLRSKCGFEEEKGRAEGFCSWAAMVQGPAGRAQCETGCISARGISRLLQGSPGPQGSWTLPAAAKLKFPLVKKGLGIPLVCVSCSSERGESPCTACSECPRCEISNHSRVPAADPGPAASQRFTPPRQIVSLPLYCVLSENLTPRSALVPAADFCKQTVCSRGLRPNVPSPLHCGASWLLLSAPDTAAF